ncbi:MAG: OmpA family protein [Ginsengibacter sp.]
MKNLLFSFTFTICCTLSTLAQEDVPGCKDSPMFNRMPNMVITECSSNFDELEFPTGPDKVEKKEGTKTFIQYNYSLEEATAPSFFQIVKNFENAITKIGGKRIYYGKDLGAATFLGKSDGKEIWVMLRDGSGAKAGNFELYIMEIEAMKQEIESSAMFKEINEKGSIALYITFETGKSTIKPESLPIVDQMVKMLKDAPSLNVSIEGHTDNTGTTAANQTLSEQRAAALVKALIDKGIDKTRLKSKGWGQTKPIADNKTEEGKTKNRRVEIVKL